MKENNPLFRIKNTVNGRYIAEVGVVTQSKYAKQFNLKEAVSKLKILRVDEGNKDMVLEKITKEEAVPN